MAGEGDIKAWRRRERERLIAARLAASAEQYARWSGAIEQRLTAFLAISTARTIGLYWPHRAEFDPRPLAERLIAEGWRAALPAIAARNAPLEYRLWQPGMAMSDGLHGIPTPEARQVVLPDLLLVPMVGFDAANYRLGYGGGYFDRTLAAAEPRPVAIGIAFELSRIESIFPGDHDIAMDVVVTEAALQEKPR